MTPAVGDRVTVDGRWPGVVIHTYQSFPHPQSPVYVVVRCDDGVTMDCVADEVSAT